MQEIRQAFKNKGFDEKSLQLIENFVKEFDDLFGKYVSKEDVLSRINENLNKITFCELENENTYGIYDGDEKEIQLRDIQLLNSEDEERLKSVFFHEMIHCITRDNERDVTCFAVKLDFEEDMDESIVTCHGLTEGFTQYVTNIRDKKYSPKKNLIVYPILAEQFENLVELIGEEKFLDVAFNKPEEIDEALGFDGNEIIYANELYEAFDDIWQEEDEIYNSKQRQNDPEEQILNAIFGKGYTKSKTLKRAKNTIIENLNRLLLKRKINTVEELNKAFIKVCHYADQLNTDISLLLVRELLLQVENLLNNGITKEEILNGCDDELKRIIGSDQLTKEFCALDKDQKLKRLASSEFEEELLEAGIYDVIFYEDFLAQMVDSIIPTDSKERSATLFSTLKNELAKQIIEKGYNVEQLSLEFIDFGDIYEVTTFNLYSYDGGRRYLGTYFENDSTSSELRLCDEQEKEEIIEKYPELEKSILLKTDSGAIMAYNGEENYSLIWNGEVVQTENITYCPSELETLEQRLDTAMSRYERLKKLGGPQFLLEKELTKIDEIKERIEAIKEKSKILHIDIEEVISDISFEDLERIIFDITNEVETDKATNREVYKETSEEGMDYDD